MRKLTRRSYNRKLIIFGLAIFLAFGMISTGFAAWLISSAATAEPNAPVEVDTIVDKSFELTIDDWNAENKTWTGATISFDAKKDDADGRVKFQENGTGDAGEQLNLTLSGTVTNAAALGKQPDGADAGVVKVEIKLPTSLTKAITEGYITLSYTVLGQQKQDVTVGNAAEHVETIWIVPTAAATEGDPSTFSVTFNFGWGAKFNGQNPCEYYDLDDAGKAVTNENMKAELEAFRLTLVGPLADGEDALTKPYEGEIKFTVTAAASY